MPATTRLSAGTLPEPPVLHLAFELANRSWKLGFSTGLGQKPRIRSVPARDLEALQREIARARRRFGSTMPSPSSPATRPAATASGSTAS